jgi:hypothetical protein
MRRPAFLKRLSRIFLTAAVCCGIFAAAAFAGSNVWLNWVNTTAHYYQSTSYKTFHQGEAEAKSHNYGCANAWNGAAWFFTWFCAPAGKGAATAAISCCYSLAPYVWNDSGYNQQMWGWQWYY